MGLLSRIGRRAVQGLTAIRPELASAGVGAGVGALANQNDPLAGALGGAALGAGAMGAGRIMSSGAGALMRRQAIQQEGEGLAMQLRQMAQQRGPQAAQAELERIAASDPDIAQAALRALQGGM